MRVATWNVNSVKQRMPRLLPWLDQRKPDVVCLQETKLADDAFRSLLSDELASRGYQVALHGEPRWNGVAILSRAGLDDVAAGIPDEPGFPEPEARAVAATCGGVRVYSVYVPNGRTPDSDHYRYKLAWLAALRNVVSAHRPRDAGVLVCGDMNIAPADADVFDPAAYVGQTHVTPPERAALASLEATGLHDVVRESGQTSASSPTGTTAPACSTRTWACASTLSSPATPSPAGCGRHGSTGKPARAPGQATTRRSSSTWTKRPTATSGPSSRRPPRARLPRARPGSRRPPAPEGNEALEAFRGPPPGAVAAGRQEGGDPQSPCGACRRCHAGTAWLRAQGRRRPWSTRTAQAARRAGGRR